jgi:branched-chain amino acid transport system ATP-binding protein
MTVSEEQALAQPAPAATPVLELRDVAVHFGGVKAVDGITLKLEPGLVYGIIGPNGSGKTTLIGAITRLTRLTRGEMLFDGRPYLDLRASKLARLGVARTFQTVRLLPDLDVVQNVQLGFDGRVDRGEDAAKPKSGSWWRTALGVGTPPEVAAAIARTGLQGFERFYPSELSYGTQRRVEIARAIAMNPRLLLLDEPTAGMNQAERAEISALIKDLRADGLCQLLVEHDVQMMIDTCDYVFAMNTGRLIAEGEPREVVRNPLVQEAYLGRKWREHAADH